MDFYTGLFLATLIFVINFIGAISGGKGLILRPLLVITGIPIHIVTASLFLAGAFTRLVKIWSMHKFRKIDWKLAVTFFPMAFFGTAAGVYLTTKLSASVLEAILGITIIFVGIFIFYNKQFGLSEKKMKPGKVSHILMFPIMFVLHIFGVLTGGMGPVKSFALMKYYGKSFITSSGTLSVINVGSSIAALFFIFTPLVDWKLVAIFIVFGSLGVYAGVHWGVKKGENFIRMLVLLVIFSSGIKLLFF